MSDVKIDDVVVAYIGLRDKKTAIAAKYKADTAALDQKMETMEGYLLQQMKKMGVTEFGVRGIGTAYSTQQTSATVGDWDAFIGYVRDQKLWNMLEHRCSKTAVVEYRNEHNELPPGVKYTVVDTVNVRRK